MLGNNLFSVEHLLETPEALSWCFLFKLSFLFFNYFLYTFSLFWLFPHICCCLHEVGLTSKSKILLRKHIRKLKCFFKTLTSSIIIYLDSLRKFLFFYLCSSGSIFFFLLLSVFFCLLGVGISAAGNFSRRWGKSWY